MSEWKIYKLGDIATFQTGKLNSNAAVSNGQYPFFTCSPITLSIDTWAFDKEAIILAGNNAEGNFSIKYYKGKFNAYQRTYIIEAMQGVCDTKFLYYSLKIFLKHFKRLSQGTSTKFLTAVILRSIEISLPPLAEQKRIADILSAIDDKIELNRRINANLEQQAQALYKSWFVDFEPFGGKMPEDWREGTLGEICTCYLGGTPSRTKSEYWSGNIPWINSGEVNKFRIIEGSEFITELGLKKSATKLLPKKTTVLAITGATLGQVSLLEIDSCANQSVIGILENKCIPYEFIYPLIKNDIDKIIRHQTGGAQQHINKNNIESHSVIIPDTKTMEQYKAIQAPVYNLIANKCFENLRLAQLRDTLLPKLMSGEITV